MNEDNADLHDAVLDSYNAYKHYEELAGQYKEKFAELSKIAYDRGMREIEGMQLVKVCRNVRKVNSSKLMMLYPDVVESLLKDHPDTVSISSSALKHIKEDVSSCVIETSSEFYSLKEEKEDK